MILLILTTLFFLQKGFAMTESMTTIVQLGNPILREKARALSLDEIQSPDIQALIQTMRDTVHGRGVGLAAPQIGYSLQIVVIEDLEKYIDPMPIKIREERGRKPIPLYTLINPKIVWMDQELAFFFEGCLSIASGAAIVPRAARVEVAYLNEFGEKRIIRAEGWHARILQHEIGHLNGTLFIDIADSRTNITMDEYKEKWMYASATDIKRFYDEKVNNHYTCKTIGI